MLLKWMIQTVIHRAPSNKRIDRVIDEVWDDMCG